MYVYPVSKSQEKLIEQGINELNRLRHQALGSLIDPDHLLRSLERLLEEGRRNEGRPAIPAVVSSNLSMKELSKLGYMDKVGAEDIELHGIRTLRDFTNFTESQVKELRSVGERRMRAIDALLAASGLSFARVRRQDNWRRLHGGPITLSQLLTLPLTSAYKTSGNREYSRIATAGIVTYADYQKLGRAGVKQAIGDNSYLRYIRYINDVFDALETPAY